MSWLSSNPDAVSCPHCGASLRRGMLRCRECGGAAEEDFQLAEQVQAETYTPRCEKCGSALGGDDEECAKCASAMLDELLSSAPTDIAPTGASRRSKQLDALQASAISAESRLRPDHYSSSEGRTAEPREERSQPGKRRRRATSSNSDLPVPTKSKNDGDLPVQKKSKAGRGGRRSLDDDAMDFLTAPAEPKAEPDSEPQSRFTRFAETDTTPESPAPSSPDAASQASAALIMSLASTDENLRCQAATALGQLGVPESIPSLEPLMADPELRVRRAVAEALIQLGHPKGDSLRAIAERKQVVAKEPPRPRASKPRRRMSLPRFSFNFMSFDHDSLVSAGGPIAGVVLVLGGIFLWHSGLVFGPRLDESYRPIKPFYAFWMADPPTAAPQSAPKTAAPNGPEMNF